MFIRSPCTCVSELELARGRCARRSTAEGRVVGFLEGSRQVSDVSCSGFVLDLVLGFLLLSS